MHHNHSGVYLFAVLLCCTVVSCGPVSTKVVSHPSGYDLEHPRVLPLPVVLNEISGLAYYAKDSSLFAIQDEEGYLYKLFPYKHDSMFRWRYADPGDYEDLCIYNQSFYILRSDGDIYHSIIGDSISTTKYDFPGKDNEFESIYYDPDRQVLRLVCKGCEQDKKKLLSTYTFDPVSRQYADDSFKINTRELAHLRNQDKIKFKPSAATIHPISGKIYLVSAINNLLVVANRDGSIDNAYELNKKHYKQPEGIAFAPDGTMFISNEFANKGTANILIIPYQPALK
jgi:uncharacterized protein YjiK